MDTRNMENSSLRGDARSTENKTSQIHVEAMGKLIDKNFSKPDEVREFPNGKMELISFNGAMVGKATLQPGWRWSTSVKSIAKTKAAKLRTFNIIWLEL